MVWIGIIAGIGIALLISLVPNGSSLSALFFGGVGGILGHLAEKFSVIEKLNHRIAKLELELVQLKTLITKTKNEPHTTAPIPAPTAQGVRTAAVNHPAPVPTPAPIPEPVHAEPSSTTSAWTQAATARTTKPQPTTATTDREETSLEVTSSLGASLRAWFTQGNAIVRIAVLILFIGVAFLLRYVAEHSHIPIQLRLIGVALGGCVLTVLGSRLLTKRRGYGLSLQGAGIGIIYLVLFSAYRLYALLPVGLTFVLLALLAAATALLAVRQNALPLAVLGFSGAFLAPVLTSTGHGSHIALFSYYLLLNLAIAWIAQRQAWKLLNVVGFFFTFSVGTAWGVRSYTPEHFISTEPFLLAHFFLYLFITVQYTRQMVQQLGTTANLFPTVDSSLLFGVPIVGFGLQVAMLHHRPLALAFSAAVMSGIYLLVGRSLWHQAAQRTLLLVEGLLALGVVFLILVVPLALDARWTGVGWALQGAGIVWVGLRQQRYWSTAMGVLLQLAAAISFWGLGESMVYFTPFINGYFTGALIIALSALCSARLLRVHTQSVTSTKSMPFAAGLHWLLLIIGLAEVWSGGWRELNSLDQITLNAASLACVLSAVLTLLLERAHAPLQWPELRFSARLMMLITLFSSLCSVLNDAHSMSRLWLHYIQHFGLLEAIVVTLLGLWLIQRHRNEDEAYLLQRSLHLILAWYVMLQSGFFLYVAGAHNIARHMGWTPTAAIFLPTLLALWLIGRAATARWPVGKLALTFHNGLFRPWLWLLALWVLVVNLHSDAAMSPLPYLPLLNPLDIGHALVLLYTWRLYQFAPIVASIHHFRVFLTTAILAFWWLNSLLIRTLHHLADTPMWGHGALDASLVQTGLSILWTLTAQAAMFYATRATIKVARGVWIAGAVLLGAVVLKLFFIDLSNSGTLARIISFLGVGALMLIIGYFSPLPPTRNEQNKS